MDVYDVVRDWSVRLDLVILARTAKTVFFGKGNYRAVREQRARTTPTGVPCGTPDEGRAA